MNNKTVPFTELANSVLNQLKSQKYMESTLVYKQVSMQFDENGNLTIPADESMVSTDFCDEKPGIQVITTTGDDLRPTVENGCVMRDAEH